MSCWMQILDLRCPKQIYWTVHAVLTHDLGECKKTIINEESTLVQAMAWRQAKGYSLL